MKFRFTADITFDAEDLQEAFAKLAYEYSQLAAGEDSDPIAWFTGDMTIEPVKP